jgi:hypothetical protein
MDKLSMAEYMYEAKGYREWEQYCRDNEEPELDDDGKPQPPPEDPRF